MRKETKEEGEGMRRRKRMEKKGWMRMAGQEKIMMWLWTPHI